MLNNQPFLPPSDLIQAMRDTYRRDEALVITDLLPAAKICSMMRARAWNRARELVVGIRLAQVDMGGVDALLNEFSLSSEEGIVLMCLAEALLRVPDKATIDRLIRDKLMQGDWSSHLGKSDFLFVNASAWGLLLTGKVVSYKGDVSQQKIGLLKNTVSRLGEPVIRSAVRYAMQIMGTQFVMGKTIGSALKRAKSQEAQGYRYSYDMLGEGARTQSTADHYFESYLAAIHAIGKAAKGRGPIESPGISVKLSAIHPRYEYSHRERVMKELVPRLKALALVAKQYDIGFTVDAEEADRLELSLEILEAVFSDRDLEGWEGFGLAIQAYQKRALLVVEWAQLLSEKIGRKMMIRLVKGAYWDSEIKWSQVEGLVDYPVFTRKPSTDVSYQACAKKLLEARAFLYPQFATHNAHTVATILEMDDGVACPAREGYEFQRLHGMGEELYDQVLKQEGVACRIYAPVGEHADLLAYLVRRLLENGANSSFVNNIIDESVPVESLLQDPVEQVETWRQKRNSAIPIPGKLYADSAKEIGQRHNSQGIELNDANTLSVLKSAMQSWWNNYRVDSDASTNASMTDVRNPANRREPIGLLQFATAEDMEQSITRAHSAFAGWSSRSVAERANLLRRLADALEGHHAALMVLCIKEAGKTPADAVAEIREAVDFCRYYADQAEVLMQTDDLKPRGVILCISPWNFPLAIFLGQVTAALATGNTVIAKPAEQTSLIALEAQKLMLQCGFPEGVVELIIAPGKPVGEQLVPDERVKGIMFTGSTDTGRWLSNTLASREDVGIPLIAETGGQNVMIVDSTALPEQVVDDVIQSGFQSAGQRCSALRVLFLQEDVADKIIEMIKGAMDELHIGDPALLSTDVGPVIDGLALKRLNDHVDSLATPGTQATLLHRLELPTSCGEGTFFAPHLYELEHLSTLKQEVFGPAVHIVRFKSDEIDHVVDQVNGAGFGLTLGVHSRIQAVCNRIAERARVGNVYINRNMIGAVVGVQPFGGCGLSGTGPKAGGPHYLTSLVTCKQDMAEKANEKDDQVKAELRKWAGRELGAGSIASQPESKNWMPVQAQWASAGVQDRVSVVRAFTSKLALQTGGEDDTSLLISSIHKTLAIVDSRLDLNLDLPGPTGESNHLTTKARGMIAVMLASDMSFQQSLEQLLMALLAGNAVTWFVADTYLKQAEDTIKLLYENGLNTHLVDMEMTADAGKILQKMRLDGVMVSANSVAAKWCQRILSKREGALLPLIVESRADFMFSRLQVEKTITVDTTAAGGNASLMTMTG